MRTDIPLGTGTLHLGNLKHYKPISDHGTRRLLHPFQANACRVCRFVRMCAGLPSVYFHAQPELHASRVGRDAARSVLCLTLGRGCCVAD